MNTINATNPSNLSTSNKFTNEIKSSFLVADILDKKKSKATEDDDDEKIDVEDESDVKVKSIENASKEDKSSSPELSQLNQLNQFNNNLNQLNQLANLNQINSVHHLNNQLNNQLNNHLNANEQESLLTSIYSRLFDAKQLDPNLLASLNQSKVDLKSLQHKPNLINNLSNPLTMNQLLKNSSNSLNENQLTNATGKFNFSSLFTTHPHLFAQSLEAMASSVGAGSSESSFVASNSQQVQNLSQITQNFPHLASNYSPTALLPSTSKLSPLASSSILEQLRTNHLQTAKEQLNKGGLSKFTLPNQANAIDLIKQFSNKMQNQTSGKFFFYFIRLLS